MNIEPFGCYLPWRLRYLHELYRAGEVKHPHGALCCFCRRDVAVPDAVYEKAKAKGKPVACIYCGLDRGLIPPVEIPPV